jgi:gamma-glutamyl hercynylcysteine S-oxide synthase
MLARAENGAANARCLAGTALRDALLDSRSRTLALVEDLTDAQWQVPQQDGINPIAWELAHLAWFGEFWTLRGPHRLGADGFVHAARPARIAGPDTLFDSAQLAHARRWSANLPSRRRVTEMLAAQLEACLGALSMDDSDEALYFHRLALFHEDMHGEALVWMRAALGYPVPAGLALAKQAPVQRSEVPRAAAAIGWPAERSGFRFDNEAPACVLPLQAFDIDSQPVTAGEFLDFVEAGGYEKTDWWRGEAAAWRAASLHAHPARWRFQQTAGGKQWQVRWFDIWTELDPDLPVIHVNAFEAEAYCAWAGRRLPSAAEWEHAATSLGDERFEWGASVWEWTADAFQPYPGFKAGPYKDYSQPWFGNHRELRGGAFATHRRMHDLRYRNFFMPHRTDIFAGFRTAKDSMNTVGVNAADQPSGR